MLRSLGKPQYVNGEILVLTDLKWESSGKIECTFRVYEPLIDGPPPAISDRRALPA